MEEGIAAREGFMMAVRSVAVGRSFVSRIVRFHLVWVLGVVLVNFVAHVAVPTDSFIPSWFVAYAPIGYVIYALGLFPVTGLIAYVLWRLRREPFGQRRLTVFAVTVIAWIALMAAWAFGTNSSAEELAQTVITFGVSIPIFGALIPIPDGSYPAEPSEQVAVSEPPVHRVRHQPRR
ncbi:MAG: hypothetical protein ACRDF7_01920 [Candidatus Limnocylindrales bacterium]